MAKKPTTSFHPGERNLDGGRRRPAGQKEGSGRAEAHGPFAFLKSPAIVSRPLNDPALTRRVKAVKTELAAKAPEGIEIVAEHPPVHPGTILREEFLEAFGLTPYAVAKACKMPRSKLERIVRGDLGISGDTAVRLGRFFGTSDRFWMNLQATYEVMKARQAIGKALEDIEPLRRA